MISSDLSPKVATQSVKTEIVEPKVKDEPEGNEQFSLPHIAQLYGLFTV